MAGVADGVPYAIGPFEDPQNVNGISFQRASLLAKRGAAIIHILIGPDADSDASAPNQSSDSFVPSRRLLSTRFDLISPVQ